MQSRPLEAGPAFSPVSRATGIASAMRLVASVLTCLALCALPVAARADAHQVDTTHSTVTVFVFKTGLFSFAADNHRINAPVSAAALSEPLTSVSLTVDAAHMTVLDKESATDKPAQVQARMLGPEVLNVAQYPTIAFKSTAIAPAPSGGWDVSGDVTIRGVTKPVRLHVTKTENHYRGSTTLKQSDFGIAPISIAGGTVKVKDEIRIDFDIVEAP